MNARDLLESALSTAPEVFTEALRAKIGCEVSKQTQVILFGAGMLGRSTLSDLRRLGMNVLGFVDNNESLWGTEVDGLLVYRPSEAADKFRDEFWVVTAGIDDAIDALELQLIELGVRRHTGYFAFREAFEEMRLPGRDEFRRFPGAVRAAFDLFADDESRLTFASLVNWQATMQDMTACRPQPANYWPDDLYRLQSGEVLADCGAYDGDTLRDFVRDCPDFRLAYSFEPDPANFKRLLEYVDGLPDDLYCRILPYQCAVSDLNGTLSFTAAGAPCSAISATGEISVKAMTLDDVCHRAPTLIKMDIEGGELSALRGASRIIRNHAPVLAICTYHKLNDPWLIPLLIHDLNPTYRIYMRHWSRGWWESICYAVPPGRCL